MIFFGTYKVHKQQVVQHQSYLNENITQ